MRSWFAVVTLCAASLAAHPIAAWWDGEDMQIAALAFASPIGTATGHSF